MDGFTREGARTFCTKGDWPGLLTYAQHWTKAEPKHPHAYFYLGVAFDNLGLPNAAIPAYEQSLTLRSDDANTWDNLAIAVFHAKGFEEAERYHKVAIQTEPEHVNALFNYGTQLAIHGRAEEAIPILKKAHELDPDNVGIVKSLVNALVEEHELEEVKTLLPAFRRLLPEEVERLEDYLESPPSLFEMLSRRLEET